MARHRPATSILAQAPRELSQTARRRLVAGDQLELMSDEASLAVAEFVATTRFHR